MSNASPPFTIQSFLKGYAPEKLHCSLKSEALTGRFLPLGDTGQYLEALAVVTLLGRRGCCWHLVGGARMQRIILQLTGQPPRHTVIWSTVSVVLRNSPECSNVEPRCYNVTPVSCLSVGAGRILARQQEGRWLCVSAGTSRLQKS